MRRSTSIITAIAVVAALLAFAVPELWPIYFHKVWRGQPYVSAAQAKNPMR